MIHNQKPQKQEHQTWLSYAAWSIFWLSNVVLTRIKKLWRKVKWVEIGNQGIDAHGPSPTRTPTVLAFGQSTKPQRWSYNCSTNMSLKWVMLHELTARAASAHYRHPMCKHKCWPKLNRHNILHKMSANSCNHSGSLMCKIIHWKFLKNSFVKLPIPCITKMELLINKSN